MAEGLTVTELEGFGLATIMARKDVDPAAIGALLGAHPPDGPRAVMAGALTLLGTGPSAWLAFAETAGPGWFEALRDRLGALASLSDQSGGYVLYRLSGAPARALLQRGAAIDLHPRAFGPGSVATTGIARIGVVLRQIDDAPSYDIALFRSFKESFRSWLDIAIAAL